MQAFLPHRDETHETVARPRTASGASGCAAARKLRIDDRSGIAAPIRKKKKGPAPRSKSQASEPSHLERNTGFEPATFALARRRSTS